MDKFKKEEPGTEKPVAEEATDEETVDQTENVEPVADEPMDQTEAEAPEAAPDEEAEETIEAEPAPKEETIDKLQEMGEKLAAMQDKYTRLYADFENYRKHATQDKIDLQLNGHKEMAKEILPVLDDMERAIAAMPDNNEAKDGVKLIYDKMLSILQKKGVKQMTTIGEVFDAALHDAVTQIPAQDEAQKNKVFDEVQKGYYINDKVLRHAKVVVAV